MTALRTGVVLCGAALLLAGPAVAQKIAPSRSYDAYTEAPRQRPDKGYGMPSFGRPESVMPQQKTTATTEPGATGAPGGAPPTDGLSAEPETVGPGLPEPDAPRDPMAAETSASTPDFFAPSTDFNLPKPGQGKAGEGGSSGDTPLFTTGDGGSAGAKAPADDGD